MTTSSTKPEKGGEHVHEQPHWCDSGYGARQSTMQYAQYQASSLDLGDRNPRPKGIDTLPQKARWPAMIIQPDSSPISEDQLTVEIKGIYAGLVIVEAKCINIDAVQACDSSPELDKGQWQTLMALNRTLLYEHHDFLVATQHPSAGPILRGLATRYSMAARMWKHGIHAFLEVLRHLRPEFQDHMLSFIYLAYQMMALLYESVPTFSDTWIECLGDLARYTMAIEEEKQPHAQWEGKYTHMGNVVMLRSC